MQPAAPWDIIWQVLNRLHGKGFIADPKNKAQSVVFTEEGIEESQRLFEASFGRGTE